MTGSSRQWKDLVIGYVRRETADESSVAGPVKENEEARSGLGRVPLRVALHPVAAPTVVKKPEPLLTTSKPLPAVMAMPFLAVQPILKPIPLKLSLLKLTQTTVMTTPAVENPLRSEGHFLWPDAAQKTAYFARSVPEVLGFSLLIRQENVAQTLRVEGGSAVLTLGAYASSSALEDAALTQKWQEELKRHHPEVTSWKLMPLSFTQIEARATVPAGMEAIPTSTSVNRDSGVMHFLFELSAQGALVWKAALETGSTSAIQGSISVKAKVLAQEQAGPKVSTVDLSTDLTKCLAGRGRESLQVMNPQVAVKTHVIIDPDPLVETVTIDWVPQGGGVPESHVFGAEGGQISPVINALNPNDVAIDVSITARYRVPEWPTVRRRERLSAAEGKLNLIVSPADNQWLRRHVVVLSFPAQTQDPSLRAHVDWSHKGPSGQTLRSAFEMEHQQISEIMIPRQDENEDADLHMTIFCPTESDVAFVSRKIKTNESAILIKVDSLGQVTITTNQDAAGESADGENALMSIVTKSGLPR